MSGAGSGYDFNSVTFSPDGRLFQVEYATKAVDKETLAMGVRCKDGVLFACEKILASPLLARNANPRIFWVDTHIACATVGYRPDSYAAVVKARNEARSYRDTFGVAISVPELVSRVASSFHQSHAFASTRPYGCALLIGSAEGPALYALEPSGQYFGYRACCFGKNSSIARAELQRTEWGEKTVAEAIPIVAAIIQGLHDNQSNKKWEIEMMWVCEASHGRPERVPEAVFQAAQN